MGFVVVHAVMLHGRLAFYNRIQVGSFPAITITGHAHLQNVDIWSATR